MKKEWRTAPEKWWLLCWKVALFILQSKILRRHSARRRWREMAGGVVRSVFNGRMLISYFKESWIRIAKCWFRIAKCWFYNKTGFIGKGMGAPGSSANLIPLCTEKTIDKVRQHDEFCIWKRGFVYLATRTFASKRWILYSNRWILQLQGAKHDEICI